MGKGATRARDRNIPTSRTLARDPVYFNARRGPRSRGDRSVRAARRPPGAGYSSRVAPPRARTRSSRTGPVPPGFRPAPRGTPSAPLLNRLFFGSAVIDDSHTSTRLLLVKPSAQDEQGCAQAEQRQVMWHECLDAHSLQHYAANDHDPVTKGIENNEGARPNL